MDTLKAVELDRAAKVAGHPFWEQFSGPELAKARMELKQQAAQSMQQTPSAEA
ncbi:hypothetical protein [Streptomyces sp. NPDC018584]|uniref:hypothetical protein n=1 Tax=unclassified Streptomyces TaxID=2593676 RepID=UPI0037AB64EB